MSGGEDQVIIGGDLGGELGSCGGGFSSHLIEDVTDEIALEGLDGITLQALKIRLEQRPGFQVEDFEDIAPAIWNQLKSSKNLRFYILPKARADLVPYLWTEHRDARGNFCEPLHAPVDIYIYHPIHDKVKGIRGSCEYYESRKDVTHIVRGASYVQILQGFGNRLVIVASQYLREQTLLGCNYRKHQNLSIVQYCIMERVARARHCGEITRGKISLGCLNIPPKTQFYQRKHLLKCNLIKRQPASIKYPGGKCPTIITVFHLPRFYRRIESVACLNTRVVFSWLNNSPTKSVAIEKVISKYGKHTLRAITEQFTSLVEKAWEEAPQAHKPAPPPPPAEEEEDGATGTSSPKKVSKPKAIRVLKLLVHDISIQNQVICKVFDDQNNGKAGGLGSAEEEMASITPGGDGGEEDVEQEVNVNTPSSYSDVQVLRPPSLMLTSTHCWTLYRALLRSGTGGLTLADIGQLMHLTPLESRSCSRFLVRHKSCKEGQVKMGKQRARTYSLANVFSGDDLQVGEGIEEKIEMARAEIARMKEMMERRKWAVIKRRKAEFLRRRKRREELKNKEDQNNEEEEMEIPVSSTIEQVVEDVVNEKVPEILKEIDKVVVTSTPVPATPPVEITSKSKQVEEPAVLVPEIENPVPVIPEDSKNNMEEVVEGVDDDGVEDTGEVPEEEEDIGFLEDMQLSSIRDREDSVDRTIRSQLSRQRVAWSRQEDRLMLLSFIGSSLFLQKYSFDRVFMFNSTQIRDILLKNANTNAKFKTNCKTSAAIRRRLHFLLRQRGHLEWYTERLSRAVRDDVLYERWIKEHLPAPQNKLYRNPPLEALEKVVEYLEEKFGRDEGGNGGERDKEESGLSLQGAALSGVLTGVDTLLFLRQLKRSEFYWNALLFVLFCKMGRTSEERKVFRMRWQRILEEKRIKTGEDGHGLGQEEDGQGHGQGLPVFDLEEVVEEICGEGEGEESKAMVKGGGGSVMSEAEMHLDYCWKLLKFLSKQLVLMFNNILMLGSLPAKGFQLFGVGGEGIVGSGSVGGGSSYKNICYSRREAGSEVEVRLWTGRCLILEEILSGGGNGGEGEKMLVITGKKERLPMEKCARALNRAKVLVCAKKGTGALHLNRGHLKQFLGGLPWYSFDEMGDMLRYLGEEGDKVDVLACMSVGLVMGIVELGDYWNAGITMGKEIFTVKWDWDRVSGDEEEEEVEVGGNGGNEEVASGSGKRKAGRVGGKKGGKKKRRKTSGKKGDDKLDEEMAESLENLRVRSSPEKQVGLEEGENFRSSGKDHSGALRLLRIRLFPPTTGWTEDGFLNTTKLKEEWRYKMMSGQMCHANDDKAVQVNFPSLELEFTKKKMGLNCSITGSSHPFGVEMLKELRRGLVELVYHRVAGGEDQYAVRQGPNPDDIERHLSKYGVLFKIINLSGVVGVSGGFLDGVFERKPLIKGLRYLLEARLIFSVGVACRKFVSYNNVRPWTIPIRRSAGAVEVVGHVIMRPWITAIGGLSWTTVNRLFMALVGQLQRPSIKLLELCQVFTPTLSSVETLVLVEALAKLKYLTIYKLNEPKPGLFSKHSCGPEKYNKPFDIEYNADTLVDMENVYVAVSPYITTLHAQLSHSIQRGFQTTRT